MTAEIADGEADFERLVRRYGWDMSADDARQWRDRLIRRVMDVGTLEDMLSIERSVGHIELRRVLRDTPLGGLRPKSWSFWHYRLGVVPVASACPPMPTLRAP